MKRAFEGKGNVIFTVIAVAMIAFGGITAALSISIGSNSADYTTDPKYDVTYYDGDTPIHSESRYLYEEFDIRFDIVPQNDKVFLGWSTSKTGTVAEYNIALNADLNTGDKLVPGGKRTATMGEKDIDLYAVWVTPKTYSSATSEIPMSDGYARVTSSVTSVKVTGSGTLYLLLDNVNLTGAPAIDMSGASGTVKIQFTGSNTLTGNSKDSEVLKNSSGLVTIFEGRDGSSLNALRNINDKSGRAIIGGTNGKMQFESGTVIATAEGKRLDGAGIGGSDANAGNVIINGGNVTVKMTASGDSGRGITGAGIGGGNQGINGVAQGKGFVTITGGNVQVRMESKDEGLLGAGIGGGGNSNNSGAIYTYRAADGTVYISGGNVDVRMKADVGGQGGQFQSAAIGGGGGFRNVTVNYDGPGGTGNVNISGGTVTTYRGTSRSSNDLGGGTNGTSNVIIDGGSVSVTNNGTVTAKNSKGTNLTKYTLKNLPSVNDLVSTLISANGGTYVDFNVTSKHNTGNIDVSGKNDSLYLYLPASDNNDVSLEYGNDGRVLFYDNITTGGKTPSDGTYYRVRYFFKGLKEGTGSDDGGFEIVHARSGDVFSNTITVTGTGTARPVFIAMEDNGTFHNVKAGSSDGNYSYDRGSGTISVTSPAGKLVFVAAEVSEYKVTYVPDQNDTHEDLNYILTPVKVNVNNDLVFKVEAKTGYVIKDVRWHTILNPAPANNVLTSSNGEYTLSASSIRSDVTITVTTDPVYYVEYEMQGTPNATHTGPSYVIQGDDLSFAVGFSGSDSANYRVKSATWVYKDDSDGTEGKVIPFNSTSKRYVLDGAEFNKDIIVTIETVEIRIISISIAGEGEVELSYEGAFDIIETDSGTISVVCILHSEVEITITNKDNPGTIKRISRTESSTGTTEYVANGDLPYNTDAEFTWTFSDIDDFYTLLIETVEVIRVDYQDNEDIDYESGLGSPDFIAIDEDLIFEIHAYPGSRITGVSFEIHFESKETIIGDPVDQGDGVYFIEYKAEYADTILVVIHIDTIPSYILEYVESEGAVYDTKPERLERTLVDYVDIVVSPENANYRILDVKWASFDDDGPAGGSLEFISESAGKMTYRLHWPENVEYPDHPVNENITITVVTEPVFNIFYNNTDNVVFTEKPTYVKADGSAFDFVANGFTDASGAEKSYRISTLWYTIGSSAERNYLNVLDDVYTIGSDRLITGDVHIYFETVEIYFIDHDVGDGVTHDIPQYIDAGKDLVFAASVSGRHVMTSATWSSGSSKGDITIDGNTFKVDASDLTGKIFVKIVTVDAFYLTIMESTGGKVTVKADGKAVEFSYGTPVAIPQNAIITLNAFADEGYRFQSWALVEPFSMSGSEYIFELDEDKQIAAMFVRVHVVSMDKDIGPGDGPTIDGASSKEMAIGDRAVIEALDIPGYRFDGWYVNGELIGTDNPFSYVMMSDEDVTITASYVVVHTITVSIQGSGTVTPGTSVVDTGTDVIFTFDPMDRMISVKLDGVDIRDQIVDGQYTLYNVTSDHSLVAIFKKPSTGGGDVDSNMYWILAAIVIATSLLTALTFWIRKD